MFTDNAKSVEHYLLHRNTDFRCGDARLYAGDMPLAAPVFLSIAPAWRFILPCYRCAGTFPAQGKRAGKPIERQTEAVQAPIAAE
jgi:hypothetical protein